MSSEGFVGDSTLRVGDGMPLVVLVGTGLQFSDQVVRVLELEFAGVRFARARSLDDIPVSEPDLRLVIVHESSPDPVTAIREIDERFPHARIAIAGSNPAILCRVHRSAGRSVGVLLMNTEIEVWLSVMRLLLCGHEYVPAHLVWEAPEVQEEPEGHSRADADEDGPTGASGGPLTRRETEILPMIARGMRNRQIAEALGVSPHTVKLHAHNIMTKLGVENRTEAANWYLSKTGQVPKSGADHAT